MLYSYEWENRLRKIAYAVIICFIASLFVLKETSIWAETNEPSTNAVMTNAEPVDNFEGAMTNAVDSADRIVFDNFDRSYIKNLSKDDISEVHILGNVRIRFQKNALKAREVIITARGEKVLEIAAYGKVELKYEGATYLADNFIFDPDKKQGSLRNVRTYLSGGIGMPISSSKGWYVKAKKVAIVGTDRIVLEDVQFTTSDEKHPHYYFSAGKVYMYQKDLFFVQDIGYNVGNSQFFYFPYFFRWDKQTSILTSFGREKRIGWYMMNSFVFPTEYGNIDAGLDIYERMGEYMQLNFASTKPMFGNFTGITFFAEIADDIRMFSDASGRYTWLTDPYANGSYQGIRQFSWHYRLNATWATNDIQFNFNTRDLNDPFFTSKYGIRRKTFDIKQVIQPDQNSFYTHSDASPSESSITRGFSMTGTGFSLTADMGLERDRGPDGDEPLFK